MDLSIIIATFGIIAVSEFGDKTQLASIALSARYQAPIPIFIGIALAFALVMGVGVMAGAVIKKIVPRKYLEVVSSLLFMAFGALFILSAVTGISIL